MVYAIGISNEAVKVVTVKAPSELKEKMREVDVNWSEYVRGAILKR